MALSSVLCGDTIAPNKDYDDPLTSAGTLWALRMYLA